MANGKNFGIAGLVLSIVGLVLGFFITSFVALPVSIVGLVLSVMGRKRLKAEAQPTGIATAGLVIGIIATVLTALGFACELALIMACGAVEDMVGDAASMF